MSEIQPELNLPVHEGTGSEGCSQSAAKKSTGTGSLGELLAEMDEIYGPVPQELLDWAERKWQELEDE
jgi:hypothetical protein